MKSRTRSRKPASIGSNHASRRPTAISASEPRTGNFVLLLVMAWSPPAHNAGIVWVSAPGDYATFNSNHTPDGTPEVGDGAPMRLKLLREKLIAFRDSAGRVGVIDHRCAHRCASLFLGRNEEGGIRCIYHGWKFDVAGNCLDMPSLPPPGFKQKVKAKAYKVVERAGVVWVYMGSRAEAPPLPAFEILGVPEDEIKVSFIQRDCNYL